MSQSPPEFDFLRIKISGILTCHSDLHIGDGDLIPIPESRKRDPEKEKGGFNSVCLDHNQQAYIPASSLRGSLCAFLNSQNKTVRKLFGYEEPGNDQRASKRKAGKIRLHDAHMIDNKIDQLRAKTDNLLPYWDRSRKTFLNHGIGVDPVTATVASSKLFRHEFVSNNTRFKVTLEADKLTKQEVQQLLGLLQRWDGSANSAIGHATSKGYGRIRWKLDQEGIQILTVAQLKQWATNNTVNDAPAYQTIKLQATDISALTQLRQRFPFTLHLYPQSPLLCNEPGYVDPRKEKPKAVFNKRGTNKQAIIPAPTLAGMLRARGHKILLTLLYQTKPNPSSLEKLSQKADKLIEQIFGSQEMQSAIEFSDATDCANSTKAHPQFFNAINRFTGSVKNQALFNVLAADSDQLKTQTCWLDLTRAPTEEGDWWKGLLFFIVRDAIEGGLAVGWGKAKGYGAIDCALQYNTLSISNRTDTDKHIDIVDAVKQCCQQDAGQWVTALMEKINKTAAVVEEEKR